MIFSAVGILGLWIVLPEGGRYGLSLYMLIICCLAIVLADSAVLYSHNTNRRLLWLGIVMSCLPIGTLLAYSVEAGHVYPYMTGKISRDEYKEKRLTTYWAVSRQMLALHDVRRIIEMGDSRCFGMPGMVIFQRNYGRTWAWVLAHESLTVENIHKRLKQYGCSHIVYNFVNEAVADPSSLSFEWDTRMIRLWREYTGRGLELVVSPEYVDLKNGGFCVYRVRDSLLADDPDHIPYLPGLENIYDEINRYSYRGDMKGWLRKALELYAIVPDVDHVSNLVGRGYSETDQWQEAYKYYMPALIHGTMGIENIWGMARSAVHLKKWSEAYQLYDKAARVYPFMKDSAERMKIQIQNVIKRSNKKPHVEHTV